MRAKNYAPIPQNSGPPPPPLNNDTSPNIATKKHTSVLFCLFYFAVEDPHDYTEQWQHQVFRLVFYTRAHYFAILHVLRKFYRYYVLCLCVCVCVMCVCREEFSTVNIFRYCLAIFFFISDLFRLLRFRNDVMHLSTLFRWKTCTICVGKDIKIVR